MSTGHERRRRETQIAGEADAPSVDPQPYIGGALLAHAAGRRSKARFSQLRGSSSDAAGRAMRAGLLELSRHASLGRLATRSPASRLIDRFVAGEDIDSVIRAVGALRDGGLRTTVDVLGESVDSAEDSATAVGQYEQLIAALDRAGLDRNVSVKLTQVGLEVDERDCRLNIGRIFDAAARTQTFVRLDMEDHSKVERTLEIWREARAANERSGVVVQAALFRTPADVDALIAERARVRLCKGAYREPASVAHQSRHAIDAAYLELMERLLREGEYPALATHDESMIDRAVAIARQHGIGSSDFEFQMLYGVRRDLQTRLAADGWTVRVYVPFGTNWFPYFMRRLAERPANVSFVLRSLWQERTQA